MDRKDFKTTQQSYHKTAQAYIQNTQQDPPLMNLFLPFIKPESSILDIGCAWGRDAHYFHAKGYKVKGIDYLEAFITAAQLRFPSIDFELMDLFNLKLEAAFDAIWCNAVLLHVPHDKLDSVLSDFNKLLTTGGILGISVKEGIGEGLELDTRYDPPVEKFISYYKQVDIISALARNGFELLQKERRDTQHKYDTKPFMYFIAKKV